MERETELPSHTASSSSSSFPPSGSELLRQMQAVFKRHRPLSGNARLSRLQARRLMGPAPEAKDEAAAPRLELGGEGSTSRRPVMGTAAEEELSLGRAPVHQMRMGVDTASEFKSKQFVSSEVGLVQVEEREQLSSSEKVQISGSRALPQSRSYNC